MTTQSIEIMLDCSSKQELFPVSVGQQITVSILNVIGISSNGKWVQCQIFK